jgi:hypothetical protein
VPVCRQSTLAEGGADFPYAENNMILPFIARWDHLLESDKELACLKAANSENAKRLFVRARPRLVFHWKFPDGDQGW